jgi:hypothetical protein
MMSTSFWLWRALVIRFLVVLATGYVLGARAGRQRYEQIVKGYRAVTTSPVAKKVIEMGRRGLANKLSPDPAMVTLTEIDATTTILEPEPRPYKK